MDYTSLFYWLVVADNARVLFKWGAGLFSIIACISTIGYFIMVNDGDQKAQADCKSWMKWSYPFMFLWWCLLVFTPSKKDALLIVAGGQTLNFLANDKSAKQIPSELSNFVLTEVKNMAKEASVDLNINNQKDKILEKAKNMTAQELMNEMKADTTFAKVILDK